MSRRRAVALWAMCLCAPLLADSGRSAAASREQGDDDPVLEIWFSIAAPRAARDELIRGLAEELARTPQRHRARFLDAAEPLDGQFPDPQSLDRRDRSTILVLLEIVFSEGGADSGLTVGIRRADDRASPGWLIHALLRAADTVRVRASVADARSSWTGQLVARSTRRLPPGQADEALAAGIPGAVLHLPAAALEAPGEGSIQQATRLLAAVARRLDGLAGPPVFEDQYLVTAGRVWLRRDLYWLCVGLWLLLFWRGRSGKGTHREFRWLFLVAGLVAPVFSAVLLALPAAAAAWRPRARWIALLALGPAALYSIRFSLALLDGARPTIDAVPAILVAAALAGFVVSVLGRRPRAEAGEVD